MKRETYRHALSTVPPTSDSYFCRKTRRMPYPLCSIQHLQGWSLCYIWYRCLSTETWWMYKEVYSTLHTLRFQLKRHTSRKTLLRQEALLLWQANSLEQFSSRGANFSPIKKKRIFHIVWNIEVHYRFRKRPPTVHYTSQKNTVPILPLYFFKLHCNFISHKFVTRVKGINFFFCSILKY